MKDSKLCEFYVTFTVCLRQFGNFHGLFTERSIPGPSVRAVRVSVSVARRTPVSLLRLSSMSTRSLAPYILPGPTDLLIRIFSHLQVTDLLSVQNTCRIFCDVISDSASLQYVLHTEVNHLEDLLPPDISIHDRVAPLKHHEIAWNSLQLNTFTRFVNSEDYHPLLYPSRWILNLQSHHGYYCTIQIYRSLFKFRRAEYGC